MTASKKDKLADRKPSTKKVELPKKSAKDKDVEKEKVVSASAASEKNTTPKIKSSRREELLKQLRAVEDAIARKRSKIN